MNRPVLRAKEDVLRVGNVLLRGKEDDLRAGDVLLRAKEEDLRAGNVLLRVKEDDLRFKEDVLRLKEEDKLTSHPNQRTDLVHPRIPYIYMHSLYICTRTLYMYDVCAANHGLGECTALRLTGQKTFCPYIRHHTKHHPYVYLFAKPLRPLRLCGMKNKMATDLRTYSPQPSQQPRAKG
jgi:hypothetical protein